MQAALPEIWIEYYTQESLRLCCEQFKFIKTQPPFRILVNIFPVFSHIKYKEMIYKLYQLTT